MYEEVGQRTTLECAFQQLGVDGVLVQRPTDVRWNSVFDLLCP